MRVWLGLVGCAVTVLCAQVEGQGVRELADFRWREEGRFVQLGGKELMRATFIVGDANAFYVYDEGASELLALRRDGSVRWRKGRRGRGPGEFSQVVGITLDAAGRLHVADLGNARLTTYDTAAGTASSQRLANAPYRLGAVTSRGAWITPQSLDPLLQLLPAGGQRTREVKLLQLDGVHAIARDFTLTTSKTGDMLVGFSYASRIVLVDSSGAVRWQNRGFEPIAFPRVQQRNAMWEGKRAIVTGRLPGQRWVNRALAFGARDVLVYFDTLPRGWALIDHFDPEFGDYRFSTGLPIRPRGFIADGPYIIATVDEPVPAVVVLRRTVGDERQSRR